MPRVSYRLTLYAPRSEDATELTVLTPVAGAPHTDPFVVTTVQGIGGAQPYLGIPKGRQGTLDPITKRTTTGNLSVSVFDPRTTPGGANSERWSTAYIGNIAGQPRLKGCRYVLERALDAGVWAPYMAGRVRNVSRSRALWLDLDLKDYADELNRNVFVGVPDGSVTYAVGAALVPIGPPIAFGNIAATPAIKGVLSWVLFDVDHDAGTFQVNTTGQDLSLGLITRTVYDGAFAGINTRIARVKLLSGPSTGTVGYYRWATASAAAIVGPGVVHNRFANIVLETLPLTDPRYTQFPSAGTSGVNTDAELQLLLNAPPSKALPLLIGDVDRVQFMADIIDGKFSLASGSVVLHPLAPRDPAKWAPFLGQFGTVRYAIDAFSKANDFLEKYVCAPGSLGYRFEPNGEIVPVDLRRPATLDPALVLTDDDLDASVEPTWSDARDGAITGVQLSYYVDVPVSTAEVQAAPDLYPDLPPTMLRTTKYDVFRVNDLSTLRDVGEKIVKIDALGARTNGGELDPVTGDPRADAIVAELDAVATDLLVPYANGAMTARATYRASGGAQDVKLGTYATIVHSKLPNPATNRLDGARNVLCIARDEQGHQIAITWLDVGSAGPVSERYWAYDAGTSTWTLSSTPADEAGRLSDVAGTRTFTLVPLLSMPAGAARFRQIAVGTTTRLIP